MSSASDKTRMVFGIEPPTVTFQGLVGRSKPMLNVFARIDTAAVGDANVVVYGRTGTGKDLVARAIHYRGPRRDKPFVHVELAAIPDSLVESELFGYEKGAFTGARRRKPGRFERAQGGTLFLDELGILPLEVQAKLLRVLQQR